MINGITSYDRGTIHLPIYFPEGKADCRHCGFCWYSDPFGVYRCRLTDEYIEKPELNIRGERCPIEMEEKTDGEV